VSALIIFGVFSVFSVFSILLTGGVLLHQGCYYTKIWYCTKNAQKLQLLLPEGQIDSRA